MIITKVTCGFVAQRFDTAAGRWLDQAFIAGDQVEYEDARGNPLDTDKLPQSIERAYLRLEMKQPGELAQEPPDTKKKRSQHD
jgi:hypothetical protein